MTRRGDAIIGLTWLVVVLVALLAFGAGLVKVAGEPTGENAYRWVMALLFLGGPLGWLTVRYGDSLRRFFKR